MGNLKNNNTNQLICKTETDSQPEEKKILWLPKAKGERKG